MILWYFKAVYAPTPFAVKRNNSFLRYGMLSWFLLQRVTRHIQV